MSLDDVDDLDDLSSDEEALALEASSSSPFSFSGSDAGSES